MLVQLGASVLGKVDAPGRKGGEAEQVDDAIHSNFGDLWKKRREKLSLPHTCTGLKLSFFIKLIDGALRAPSLCCYRLRLPGDSHDALGSSLLLPLSLYPSIYIH